ncbi:MAG: dihydrodipicolinate synthase family protein [Verrucomicrobia bacterium]|nr:dihydrodipicolinate synthase family protein [Verrucomicrobiota bacterium]
MSITWTGVMPATTTEFLPDGNVDHDFLTRHANWLIDSGCTAIVCHGSLGEGATLSFEEKSAVQQTYVKAVGDRAPVIAGVAALTTADAVKLAQTAKANGCRALMVLPPYLYPSDWREMKTHMLAVINATDLPCIIYNNPVAYKTDFTPSQIKEIADACPNAVAVKESSTDVRRIAEIRELCGDRLALGVGVDDCALEGAAMGAKFWIAGAVNGIPVESVKLWELGCAGEVEKAMPIYIWMLPLLRMDTVVKFVQLIKLIQHKAGWGSNRVRAPRLELTGAELAEAERAIEKAFANRPS